MKKLLFTAAAVCAFGFANAQDDKEASEGFSNGDIFISGAFNFGTEKTGDDKSTSFEVMPRVGFFVADNIAIGAQIGFGSTKDEVGGVEAKTNMFSVGAFGRYYWTPASKFSVFGQLGLNYTSEENAAEVKTNGFEVEVAPGISYFLNDSFAIEASWGALRYSNTKPDVDGADSTTGFELGLDMNNINFGLLYKF